MNIQKRKDTSQTRKASTMKNTITRVDALNTAINTVEDITVKEVLTKIRDQIAKPRASSDEAKAKRAAKQKEATAKARAEMVAQVAPILRKVIDHDMTAKEIFAAAQGELPEGFTAPKVQNILLREMKDELVKSENGRNACTYRLA